MPRLRLSILPSLPRSLALAVASGAALSLAFPPAGWFPIAFVGLVPLLWLLRGSRPGRGALVGLAFGVGFYGATLYWILRFGILAWAALVLLMALSTAVFGALSPLCRVARGTLAAVLGPAALWTLVDWVRGTWPLGGFTWGELGVSQVGNRLLLPLASVAGVWGVTFAIVAVNALVLEAVVGGGGVLRRAGRVGLAAALIFAPAAIPFPSADGPSIDVAAIQVDVRSAERPDGSEEDLAVARLNMDLHATLANDPPDLAVWGEGALDPAAAADPATVAAVRSTIASVGAPTLVGAVLNDPGGAQTTSVLVFDGRGEVVDRYDKVHLVPFGEYVPWRRYLGWIDAISQVPIDRTPGERLHTLTAPGLPPIGAPICFENSFPDLPRDLVNDGAEFLVVPVNNASYGFTAASEQHLQMSRIRAVETGRWVVNAAVSGVSAFVDPSGRVVEQAGLFEPAIVRASIRASTARTWFVRLGDWVVWLSGAIVLALFLLPRRRPGPSRSLEPLIRGPRTLVILPTYEERETIERVVRGVLMHEGVEILVVDDASPDGTATVVRTVMETEPRVRLHERPAKSGLASAYLEGFGVALAEQYDVAVEMDADLSHDPGELGRLLEGARRHALTIGSRYVEGGSVTNWSRARLALSRGGNLYATFMLGLPVRDATSGYRAYRRELLEQLLERPVASDGYGFQVELVLRAYRLGYDVGEVPITFREREHGHSKISRRIVAEALWLITKWGLALRFGAG